MAVIVLIIDAFLEPGRTFNIVLISSLRGAGDVIFPVIMAAISMWGVSVLLAYILVVSGSGLPGIWIASLLDEWIREYQCYIAGKEGNGRRNLLNKLNNTPLLYITSQ